MAPRYFLRIQDNPKEQAYLNPLSVHRFEVTDLTVITERWDATAGVWVDNPELLNFTGIGGADDYREVDVAEAERILKQMGQGPKQRPSHLFEIPNEPRRQNEFDEAQQVILEEDRKQNLGIIQRAAEQLVEAIWRVLRGGPGSGHHGHEGRPGEIGGSAPGEGGGKAEFGRGKAGTYIAVPREAAKVGMTSAQMNAADISQPSGGTVRGTVMAIDDPRIPEVVYHMTTNITGVQNSNEISAGGAGGLEGDPQDQMVSMTIDEPTAEGLVRDTRLVATIAKEFGQTQPEYGNDRTIWGRSLVDRITQLDSAAKDANWEWEGLHPLQYKNHGLNDIVRAYMISRELQGGINNPLFFGEIKDMARLDPEEVGYVRIPRGNLDTGALLTNFDLDNPYGLKEIRLYGDVPLKGAEFVERGGPGSGHHGHAGRPGEVGGSQAGEGMETGRKGKSEYRGFLGSGLSMDTKVNLNELRDRYSLSKEETVDILTGAGIPQQVASIAWDRAKEGNVLGNANPDGKQIAEQVGIMAAPKANILDPDENRPFSGIGTRSDALVDRLGSIESEITELDYETLYVVDSDGNVVIKKDGGSSYVMVDDIYGHLEGNIIVHNHPSGNSFSHEDIAMAYEAGVAEIHAYGNSRRYIAIMNPKDKNSPTPQGLYDMIGNAEADVYRSNVEKINNNQLTNAEAGAIHSHEVMSKLIEIDPTIFTYIVEERP